MILISIFFHKGEENEYISCDSIDKSEPTVKDGFKIVYYYKINISSH